MSLPVSRPGAVFGATLLGAFLVAAVALVASAGAVDAAGGLLFPAPAGTQWEVISGYNTETHEGVDPYALDFARVDRKTAGTPVLAPVDGRVGYVSDTCVSVRTDDLNVLMCHVFASAGLERGREVLAGDQVATVAPDGEAGNNGIAHIHLQVNRRSEGGRGSSGEPVALAGAYALEGVSFAATTEYNAHYLERVTSSNDAHALPTVDAGADRTVYRGATVTLTATGSGLGAGATSFAWQQVEGATVALQPSGASATFTVPDAAEGTLRFQVTATGPRGVAVDTVRVRVTSTTPISGDTRGRILSGQVPEQGVGLVLFGGGTNEELVSASGCEASRARFFATVDGRFVVFIPGAQVPLVNQDWDDQFPEGLPQIPLLARCA